MAARQGGGWGYTSHRRSLPALARAGKTRRIQPSRSPKCFAHHDRGEHATPEGAVGAAHSAARRSPHSLQIRLERSTILGSATNVTCQSDLSVGRTENHAKKGRVIFPGRLTLAACVVTSVIGLATKALASVEKGRRPMSLSPRFFRNLSGWARSEPLSTRSTYGSEYSISIGHRGGRVQDSRNGWPNSTWAASDRRHQRTRPRRLSANRKRLVSEGEVPPAICIPCAHAPRSSPAQYGQLSRTRRSA